MRGQKSEICNSEYIAEVDLGDEVSSRIYYDDGPDAAEARQTLLSSMENNPLGYTAIVERSGHKVTVINTEELFRLGIISDEDFQSMPDVITIS